MLIRIEFECPGLARKKEVLRNDFLYEISETFQMDWKLSLCVGNPKIAIFVSRELHCLRELLWDWQSGDLMAEIALVVSNHEVPGK